MSIESTLSNAPRRASLVGTFAAGVVLLVAPLSVAVAVNPWQATPSDATEVAAPDAPRLNVLEQPRPAPKPATLSKADSAERAVSEWTPTDGGTAKGSPKK